jgi:predicted heme/steroid binding protein
MKKYFLKIEKISAWVLFFVILAYAITGFGMTKGIIDRKVAESMHLGWLGAIAIVAFVIHTGYSISLALRRWCVWNIFSKIILVGFYIAIISLFIYLQLFYQGSDYNSQRPPEYNNSSINDQNLSDPTIKIFTAETLAQYNGQNGQPSYVAVDGTVYDVSSLFKGGLHYGWSAGRDLSSEFHMQHTESYLNGFPVVGKYQQ